MDTRAITVLDRRDGLVGSGESQRVASQRRWSNGTQLWRRVGRKTLACIAHSVGRIKTATHAGTAQTRISGHHSLSLGSGLDWRTPLRLSSGLLGPAYHPLRNAG